MLTAIIVAAGSGQRMGFDKLFAPLNGKPVVVHAIAAFENAAQVNEIILTVRQEQIEAHEKLIRAHGFSKVRKIIPGGERRQDSVRAGLKALSAATQFVAVHDAARPLVRPAQIAQVFEMSRRHGAAALAEPVKDTLKRVSEDGFISDSVDREKIYALQTPQIFARDLLERAYDAILSSNIVVTDETSALDHIGEKVAIVPNDDFNFKITYPNDLWLAESILAHRVKEKSAR
jgi:2-C-methyl-D-erythritol 4-phosphate cytidylyltransferase